MLAKKRVEEFMRLKSSIQEERGGGEEQAGAEDSHEEHASPEVLIEFNLPPNSPGCNNKPELAQP